MRFEELFQNPPAQYRGAPFWSWNCRLDPEILPEQIDAFKAMGFGGYHIHSRIGLATEYLGEEFMECVKRSNEYGKQLGMLTWLYDEDTYPSGFAGGKVTKREDYCQRCLLLSPEPVQARLLARYAVQLKNGELVSYRRLAEEEQEDGCWYAYEKIIEPDSWYNDGCYGDVLNYGAVQEFIECTHEVYKNRVGAEFGKSIPAIFTDEPQFCQQQPLADGAVPGQARLAYTVGIEGAFREDYGYDLLEHLPELFWQRADGVLPQVRLHYFDLLARRYADSYCGQIGRWCRENGLQSTGHIVQETSLEDQTEFCGDCMRSYIHFDIPGIDVLGGMYEYTGMKQAQSVARQEGKDGVLSELYGVTGWDYDFRGHKLQGDWQAALGVTVRVPHLSWMSMRGEAKRDYPAPIDGHSPWHKNYHMIEDHFARVHVAMSGGESVARIAVIHPIESFWMLYGPNVQTKAIRKQMDAHFRELAQWLLFGMLDFDYLCEGLLPQQQVYAENGKLHVGQMTYDVVIVPQLLTVRQSTLDILEQFRRAGGTVIAMGDLPRYVDGRPEGADVQPTVHIGFEREKLLEALEPWRDVDARLADGTRVPYLVYQLRRKDDALWLFVAHGREVTPQEAQSAAVRMSVCGTYDAQLLDTMSGQITALPVQHEDGQTHIDLPVYAHDSVLLRLSRSACAAEQVKAERKLLHQAYFPGRCAYETEEPNVLLLDQAKWRLDDGCLQDTEEILKIDDAARDLLGLRRRDLAMPQPWSMGQEEFPRDHTLELHFTISSEIEKENVELALEDEPEIVFNGQTVMWSADRWYVDRSLHRIALGTLKKGENTLMLRYPFGQDTQPEWCYLLGDFGVQVTGRKTVIVKKQKTLGFGSYHTQGLPFYGGNLTYEARVCLPAGLLEIEIPHYSAAVLGVRVDGGEEKLMFAAPYRVQLGEVPAGEHTVRICSYGTRVNQFGNVHCCNDAEKAMTPQSWRTTGVHWCYEYRLKDVGVLTAPILRVYAEPEQK